MLAGGYWHVPPTAATTRVVAFAGVIAPEAVAAREALGDGAALLQVTSYDRMQQEWKSHGEGSYVAGLLSDVPRGASIVTVIDGHPATLSWLGSVHGHRVRPLGVQAFGQTGDLPDLYRHHGIDMEAIVAEARK